MSKTLPFPTFDEPVTLDLGDGKPLPLRYTLMTLRRLSKRLGQPMLGRKGSLLDITEDNLAELLFEGLCDPVTGEAPTRASGEILALDDLHRMPSSALVYLINTFTTAYNQAVPEKNPTPPAPAPATPATKPN